jgi:NAD(P)H-dependent FMN reductase
MTRLQIIVGSTREGRAADVIVPWVTLRAREQPAFDVEVLDLREWPLPFFAENQRTIGNFADPTYSAPIVREWNKKIAESDGYLFVTPEYNHSVPAVLKNAIDSVFLSFAFRNKPAGFVSYSGSQVGGARAIEHLAHIAIEAEMVPLRNTVILPNLTAAFRPDARADAALGILLEDLAWWSQLLADGRARGALPPGRVRLQAAVRRAEGAR